MSQFEQKVLPLFEASRADWLAAARRVALDHAKKHGQVTIDDVRNLCPPPDDIDPRVMGAVLAGKLFRKIGYQNSSRSDCHGRPIGVFAVAEC